jgi:hypothetical protein
LTKNGLGYTLGDFFTNQFGHPDMAPENIVPGFHALKFRGFGSLSSYYKVSIFSEKELFVEK